MRRILQEDGPDPCSFTESLGTEEYVVEHVVAGGGPITT